jgi:hypothetical protein
MESGGGSIDRLVGRYNRVRSGLIRASSELKRGN